MKDNAHLEEPLIVNDGIEDRRMFLIGNKIGHGIVVVDPRRGYLMGVDNARATAARIAVTYNVFAGLTNAQIESSEMREAVLAVREMLGD